MHVLLVRYLFIISISVIGCLVTFVSEMGCYASSRTLKISN